MNAKEFITGFVKGTLGKKTKHDRWSIINWGNMDVLVYTSPDEHNKYIREGEEPEFHEERVAYKMQDGSVISNANQLQYAGQRFAWGREVRNRGPVDEQRWLEAAGAIPIPFALFAETNTDVRDFSWIVKPVAEDVKIKERDRYTSGTHIVKRHFSGACLFAIDKDTYLFDIDRKEIADNNIFNPFVTKLPKRASTIQEAYEILMPNEVKTAIEKGTEVLRQGEFFFIKHSDECPVKVDMTDDELKIIRFPPSKIGFGIETASRYSSWAHEDRDPFKPDVKLDTPEKREYQIAALRYAELFKRYSEVTAQSGTLGKSATGSHNVEKYLKVGDVIYASGKISQSRREHGDLELNGWYEVMANTGTISWTIRGEID